MAPWSTGRAGGRPALSFPPVMAYHTGMGRHTKYNADMQAAADDYVNGGYVHCNDVVPSRAGLACELSVSRNTLTNWGEEHAQFLSTLEKIDHVQERISLSGGLRGDLNSTIVKLLLANHGYSDKQAVDHRSPDGSMSPTRIEIRPGAAHSDD